MVDQKEFHDYCRFKNDAKVNNLLDTQRQGKLDNW